jgi:hypothetical protein
MQHVGVTWNPIIWTSGVGIKQWLDVMPPSISLSLSYIPFPHIVLFHSSISYFFSSLLSLTFISSIPLVILSFSFLSFFPSSLLSSLCVPKFQYRCGCVSCGGAWGQTGCVEGSRENEQVWAGEVCPYICIQASVEVDYAWGILYKGNSISQRNSDLVVMWEAPFGRDHWFDGGRTFPGVCWSWLIPHHKSQLVTFQEFEEPLLNTVDAENQIM